MKYRSLTPAQYEALPPELKRLAIHVGDGHFNAIQSREQAERRRQRAKRNKAKAAEKARRRNR